MGFWFLSKIRYLFRLHVIYVAERNMKHPFNYLKLENANSLPGFRTLLLTTTKIKKKVILLVVVSQGKNSGLYGSQRFYRWLLFVAPGKDTVQKGVVDDMYK